MSKGLLGLALSGLAFLAFPAFSSAAPITGTLLPPGATITSAPSTTFAALAANNGAVLVTNISGTFVTPGGETGTYFEQVLRESGGTLDFAISVSNTSSGSNTSAFKTVSTLPFDGFQTSILYDSSVSDGALGSLLPLADTRDPGSGQTVAFDFNGTSGGLIAPGTGTQLLIIQTDATLLRPGVIAVIDGGSVNLLGFAPTAIPLPSAAWGGLALLGMLFSWQYVRRSALA